MQVAHQLWHLRVHIHQALGELVGVAGGVANALDARDVGHVFNQQGKVGDVAGATHGPAVSVDVLAQQGDLFDALRGQAGHLDQHIVQRAVDLFAPGIGHHAIAAVFGATLHDADKCRGTRDPRGGQVIELFNLRELNIDLWLGQIAPLVQQLRQAVQGLRSKHHVHKRRAGDDGRPFLAGHTTAHRNAHPLFRQVLDPAQVGKHFFLGLLAHRAGVEHNQIGLFHIIGGFIALGLVQQIGHFVRVVLVHLATEGFDENFGAHGAKWAQGRVQRFMVSIQRL